MNWNMPLPNGEPALVNEVTLKADLTLVARRRNDAHPRDQRLAPRRDSNNTALLRALREEAPAGRRASSSGTA